VGGALVLVQDTVVAGGCSAGVGTAHARHAVRVGGAGRPDRAGRAAAAAVGRALVTVARAVGAGDLGALAALLGAEEARRAIGRGRARLALGAAGSARAAAVRGALALVGDTVVTAGRDALAVLAVQRRAVPVCHTLGCRKFGFRDWLQQRAAEQLRVARARARVGRRGGLTG